jgi:hypothetical protein
VGLRRAALEFGADPGHLSGILGGKRKLTDTVLEKLKVIPFVAKLSTNASRRTPGKLLQES